MEGRYKIIVEDYDRKGLGKIISGHTTVMNARKAAFTAAGKYNNRMVSVYDTVKRTPMGGFTLIGGVLKWYSGERHWYPSKDGHYVSAGKYRLYASGKIGQRLR